MPPNPDYEVVCAYLRSLNIHFCERWVTESIHKLRSTNPGLSTNEIRKGVYEIWLSTNLRDLKVGSLPPNILSYEKITLSGTYAIQVESMVNSARSGYSELQRIENPGNCENVTDKTDEDAKSKRCLTFVLCDGVQVVQAMEYQFIPAIKLNDPDFLPGFKMIVKGPVVCRKGMLLLQQENVKVYGGKVDSLCETNSLLKLLRTKLGLSTNNSESNKEQTVGSGISNPVTQSIQSEEVMEHQVAHSNTGYGSMEVDELLSQNDDILLSLPFESGFEDESSHNNPKPDVENEHCFQVPKKPRINSSHENIIKENNNKQLSSNKIGSVYGRQPITPESLSNVRNGKGKPDATNFLNCGSLSNNNRSNKTTPKQHNSFIGDGDDIIFEDDLIFESQCLQRKPEKRIPDPTPEKSQMKISSYLTGFKEPNTPVIASTSSNSLREQTPKIVMTYPFVYLKQITDISLAKPTKFTVKAIILTLKSKISIKNDEFALMACISDGSSTIQVNFSSETLESILEYSPCEVTSMMSEKTKNSAVAERLKGIFFSAQQKLLSMNCLMKIQFFNNSATPLVVGLEEIQLDHVNALKVRSC